jgi:hypothetical protein
VTNALAAHRAIRYLLQEHQRRKLNCILPFPLHKVDVYRHRHSDAAGEEERSEKGEAHQRTLLKR